MAPPERRRRADGQGWEEEGCIQPGQGDGRHRQPQAHLRNRQDQAIRATTVGSLAGGLMPGGHLPVQVAGRLRRSVSCQIVYLLTCLSYLLFLFLFGKRSIGVMGQGTLGGWRGERWPTSKKRKGKKKKKWAGFFLPVLVAKIFL